MVYFLSLCHCSPCKPSKSWDLMHRLPYFSTELTVACREGCTLCVRVCLCACALVPFLEASLCSLRTSAQAPEPPGSVFSCKPLNLALVGRVSVFFPSHHKRRETSLLSQNPVLTGGRLTRTGPAPAAQGCCWLQQKINTSSTAERDFSMCRSNFLHVHEEVCEYRSELSYL